MVVKCQSAQLETQEVVSTRGNGSSEASEDITRLLVLLMVWTAKKKKKKKAILYPVVNTLFQTRHTSGYSSFCIYVFIQFGL